MKNQKYLISIPAGIIAFGLYNQYMTIRKMDLYYQCKNQQIEKIKKEIEELKNK